MNLRRAPLALAPVVALALTACGDDEPTVARDASTTITLGELDGRAFEAAAVDSPDHDLVAGTRVRLSFDGDDLSAHAGCNHLFGTADLHDEQLTVGRMGGTEMGCEPALAEQDTWLQGFLGGGPAVALDGTTLTLSQGATTMELTEVPVPTGTGDPDQATNDAGLVVD
jgi:heat shock protein HslJ